MAGSPEKDRSLERRVSQLERDLSATRKQLERQTRRLFQHHWPRDVRLAKTVDGGETYPATGNTFYIELLDSWFPATIGQRTPTHELRGERLVGHVLDGSYLAKGAACFVLFSRGLGAAGSGEWWIWPVASGLVELCAQEIAVRNTPYNALLGTWNSALGIWCYDGAPIKKAIDHRKGPPTAEVGWKGLYQPMPHDTYGTIYVLVSLDCKLPEEGCNACVEA